MVKAVIEFTPKRRRPELLQEPVAGTASPGEFLLPIADVIHQEVLAEGVQR
jgi:hypothetical protein